MLANASFFFKGFVAGRKVQFLLWIVLTKLSIPSFLAAEEHQGSPEHNLNTTVIAPQVSFQPIIAASF